MRWGNCTLSKDLGRDLEMGTEGGDLRHWHVRKYSQWIPLSGFVYAGEIDVQDSESQIKWGHWIGC